MNVKLLRQLLEAKGIRICKFAAACNCIAPSFMSALLSGWQPIGPRTRARLELGMPKLGFSESEIKAVLTEV